LRNCRHRHSFAGQCALIEKVARFGGALKPHAKLIVEWKMIVNKDFNSADPTLKKWMTAIRYLHMAKRSASSSAKNLIPPLPIDFLQ
jgi:hypothetical protein